MMPIFLLLVGIILIVSGVRGKSNEFLTQAADDGKHFLPWFFLIIAVGVVGEAKSWRGASNAFLALIVIAYVLKNGNTIIAGFNSLINESKS